MEALPEWDDNVDLWSEVFGLKKLRCVVRVHKVPSHKEQQTKSNNMVPKLPTVRGLAGSLICGKLLEISLLLALLSAKTPYLSQGDCN